MDKSGALDLNWDGGQYVGMAQAANVLAVAAVAEGKEVIMIMNVNVTDLSKEVVAPNRPRDPRRRSLEEEVVSLYRFLQVPRGRRDFDVQIDVV